MTPALAAWLGEKPWDDEPHHCPPYGRECRTARRLRGWGITLSNEHGHCFDAEAPTLGTACRLALAKAKCHALAGDPERFGR